MTKRNEVLDTAKKLISGERAKAYRDAREGFRKIGKLWEQVLGVPVTADQVALCMIQIKIARATQDTSLVDNWVDIAGYAALGAEIATGSALFSEIMSDLDTAATSVPEPVPATSSIIITLPQDQVDDEDVVDDARPTRGKR